MSSKNLIWGIIFIVIGGIFLLRNFDIVFFNWRDVWELWPFIIIIIGIAVLPLKNFIKIILVIIAIIIAFMFLVRDTHHDSGWPFDFKPDKSEWNKTDSQIISEDFDSVVTTARFIFDAAAGNFKMSQPCDQLFEFKKIGSVGKYNYSVKDLGSEREIIISMDNPHVRAGKIKNDVQISLNTKPTWDLDIDVGAAEIDMDLKQFKVQTLNIDGGAASIDLTLGNLADDARVTINAGASSINISVPKEVTCYVNTDAVLSSKNFEDFSKVDQGSYVSQGTAEGAKKITIDIDVAISSITVERY